MRKCVILQIIFLLGTASGAVFPKAIRPLRRSQAFKRTREALAVARRQQPHTVLPVDSRARLAAARARGDAMVMLVIAAREGQTAAVVRAIRAVSGTIRYRDDDVSYVRARVPIGAVEQLLEVTPIVSAAVDYGKVESLSQYLGRFREEEGSPPPPGTVPVTPVAPPRPSRESTLGFSTGQTLIPTEENPMARPADPLQEMRARDWRRSHPTYDGRGITVAHVENIPDLFTPELQVATTLDGRLTRKIIDARTTISPEYEGEPSGINPREDRATWVDMRQTVTATGGSFQQGDTRYTAPRAGRFRFGMAAFFYNACRDIREIVRYRDLAKTNPSPCAFAMLWDPVSAEVWVDTDADRNFANEQAMQDYHVRYDVGTFGRDDPSTARRETWPFVIQTASAAGFIAILFGDNYHATAVAASVGGSRGPHGSVDGIAPGISLVEVTANRSRLGALVEGLIPVFRDPRVDLVLFEAGSPGTNPYPLRDGSNPATIITGRLIAKFQKPFVATASNLPALKAVDEIGNARWGFAVGGAQSTDSYRINDGLRVRREDNLHRASSWGPGGDGSISPTVLAPTRFLTAYPRSLEGKQGIKGLYELPPGYAIFGGTSQATPCLAGALALLMSAAKQEHVPYDPKRLWLAVTNSARYIPHIGAYQQGNGIVDVGAAFELLKAYAANPPSIEIVSRGPVHTPYSKWLATPHEGVSLFESEGWHAGMCSKRMLKLTRTTGPKEPVTFTLSWLGNEAGTFSVPSAVTLPLNQPVSLGVDVAPKTMGVHSALLSLDHPSVPGHVYRLMMTIVAADHFEADRQWTITRTEAVERPVPAYNYYVDVPVGVAAIVNEITMGEEKPQTKVISDPPTPMCAINNRWLSRDPQGTSEGTPLVPVHVKATLLGAATQLASAVPALTPGTSAIVEAEVQNRFSVFTGSIVPTALASGRVTRGKLRSREQRMLELSVPTGAQLLDVTLASPGEDVTLYVFDCTTIECRAAPDYGFWSDLDNFSTHHFFKRQPRAGRWVIVVDAATAPMEGVAFEVRDLILDPTLGAVSTTDIPRVHPVGDSWRAALNLSMVKMPLPGRDPYLAVLTEAIVPNAVEPVPVSLLAVPLGTIVRSAAGATINSRDVHIRPRAEARRRTQN